MSFLAKQKGWKVWAGSRRDVPNELKQIANIRFCHLDVTDNKLIQGTVKMILKEDGQIDALISVAVSRVTSNIS